jgi:hypothetical protein
MPSQPYPHCQHHPRQPVNDNTDTDALRFHIRRINNPYSLSHTARVASNTAAHPSTSNLQLPGVENMPSPAPRRFAGDGFDYRRPAGATREPDPTLVDLSGEDDDDDIHVVLNRVEDVIDLTADDSGYGASQDGSSSRRGQGNNGEGEAHRSSQNRHHDNGSHRLPRGMDIIIDLDNGDEDWALASPPPAAPGSPEIQFLSARAINPQRRAQQVAPQPDGDEVEFVGSNALSEEEQLRRRHRDMDRALNLLGDMRGRFTHLRAQVDRFNAEVSRTAATFPRPPIVPPRGAPRARGHVHVGFAAPGLLDFDMVAFDMGLDPGRAPQAPPTYQAPPAAPEGFVRSPEEEGALVCPNCEEELCVGDNEVKRQVWIVKTCGHVSSTTPRSNF